MIGNWLPRLIHQKIGQRFALGILVDTMLLVVGMVVAYYIRVAL